MVTGHVVRRDEAHPVAGPRVRRVAVAVDPPTPAVAGRGQARPAGAVRPVSSGWRH